MTQCNTLTIRPTSHSWTVWFIGLQSSQGRCHEPNLCDQWVTMPNYSIVWLALSAGNVVQLELDNQLHDAANQTLYISYVCAQCTTCMHNRSAHTTVSLFSVHLYVVKIGLTDNSVVDSWPHMGHLFHGTEQMEFYITSRWTLHYGIRWKCTINNSEETVTTTTQLLRILNKRTLIPTIWSEKRSVRYHNNYIHDQLCHTCYTYVILHILCIYVHPIWCTHII